MTPALLATFLLSFSCHGDSRHAAHGIHCRQFLALADRDLLACLLGARFRTGVAGRWILDAFLEWRDWLRAGGSGTLHGFTPHWIRRTLLIVHCVAALPFAAVVEWYWLQTGLSTTQAGCIVLILAGVALALLPIRRKGNESTLLSTAGSLYGLVGALGQGMGAVMSRVAYDINAKEAFVLDGLGAAYQRILGGLMVAAVALWYSKWKSPFSEAPLQETTNTPNHAPAKGKACPLFWPRLWQALLLE